VIGTVVPLRLLGCSVRLVVQHAAQWGADLGLTIGSYSCPQMAAPCCANRVI
jgi:hypothetical protein